MTEPSSKTQFESISAGSGESMSVAEAIEYAKSKIANLLSGYQPTDRANEIIFLSTSRTFFSFQNPPYATIPVEDLLPGVRIVCRNCYDVEDMILEIGIFLSRAACAPLSASTIITIAKETENTKYLKQPLHLKLLNTNNIPSSEDEAFKFLQGYIYPVLPGDANVPDAAMELRTNVPDIDHDLVLSIVKAYPGLARRKFKVELDDMDDCLHYCFSECRLFQLLLGSPNPPPLELIQYLLSLDPTAIYEDGNYSALHTAVIYRCPDPILEFLCKQNPSAAWKQSDSCGGGPTGIILERIGSNNDQRSISALQILLENCDSLVEHGDYSFGNLFEMAFGNDCPAAVLHQIADYCQGCISALHLEVRRETIISREHTTIFVEYCRGFGNLQHRIPAPYTGPVEHRKYFWPA